MVMMMAADAGLLQRLGSRQLAGRGRILKIARQLVELSGQGGIPRRLRGLRGGLQIGRDLPRHLLKLGRIALLELLQQAQHHCGRRELLRIRDLAGGGGVGRAGGTGGIARSAEHAAYRTVEGIQAADRHGWLLV